MKENNMLACTFFACKTRFSCFKNTLFVGIRFSPLTIIKTLDMWLEAVPFDLIAQISNVSRSTVSSICKKLRSHNVLGQYLINITKLGGKNSIIEIDESKTGKRKFNRGHRIEGVWVVGALERATKKLILKPILKRDVKSLTGFRTRYIHRESIIYSDCWKKYSNLKKHFKKHKTVNHSKKFLNRKNNVHTNPIE